MIVPSRFGPRALVTAGTALAVAAGVLAPDAFGAAPARTYVVQLASPALASYEGGTRGIPATSPKRTGDPLRTSSAAARRYRAFLTARQRAALARVPGATPRPIYSYRTAFAGFAAKLTAAQAEALRRAPQVTQVWRDERLTLTQAPPGSDEDAALGGITGGGASYLRLPTGLWQRLGGVDHAGEGVIVGVIDTGITQEHPSFADRPSPGFSGPAYEPPEVWDGMCQGGEGFPASACNNKLIGARYFVEGFEEANLADGSDVSPRDNDGHGTHTASTAAGNYGVDPVIDGNDLGVDVISGIAPRAYVAAYKVCWSGLPADGCVTSDSVAAIDAAVADGVDVINFSIGSNTSTVLGATAIAFLGASDAGVFVANSAGNNGPGVSTVGSPGSVPWITTVAASTTRQSFEATLTVTAPSETISVQGASVGRGLPPASLVDGEASGLPDADPADAAGCLPGTLDATKVIGKNVLCFGNRMRAVRARAVEEAGGVGIVLANPEGGETLFTDNHRIPGIHISHADGLRVKALIGPDTVAQSTPGRATALPRGAIMADFSSRGPQTAVPDIGKPDVTAPGVQILAGAAPDITTTSPFLPGQLFQVISGTSMSSPHVAGAAALLKQLHPLFTPAELKSSLMTTANPDVLREDGETPATPFDAGAGEIDPNRAADPGLVLDVGTPEYLSYLEAVDPDLVGGDIPTIEPLDLNLPTIAISEIIGTRTTTRTLRSVEPRASRWTVSVDQPPGFDVTATPLGFTIRAGQEQEITISAERTAAPFDAYASGAVVLTSGDRRVRIPFEGRPVPVAAPDTIAVTADAGSGSEPITVTSGFSGTLNALGWGLAAPDTLEGETVTTTTGAPDLSGDDPGTNLYPVSVPEGGQLIAGRIANADGGEPGIDLDLYLYRDPNGDGDFGDAERLAFSADVDSEELVVIPLPEPGEYVFAVVGYATTDPVSTYDFTTWLGDDTQPDDPAPPPGLVVSGDPVAVSAGQEVELSLDWSDADTPETYFGLVTYHDADEPGFDNAHDSTLVELTVTGGDGT